jgi:integrase
MPTPYGTRFRRIFTGSIKAYSSGFLDYAMALKFIDSNPAHLVRLPRQHETKVQVTPSEPAANELLETLADPRFTPCFEMMVLSCCTSIHYSEMAALRWRRVNLTGEPTAADGKNLPAYSVSVMEGYYRGEFGPPKNRGRYRIEAMPDEVVEVLAAHKARSELAGPDDLVFCTDDGKPLSEDQTRRKLVTACKKAGIPRLGWHAFRRYFATQTDRNGMHPLDRQNSLGHASQEMTAHYTTEDLERRRPAVKAIAKGLFKERR